MASSHLMLPVIYNILKKNNYINFLPSELVIYLKNIYNLNESRNTILLKEAKEISEILSNKNIKFVFLKGANYLINNIYDEIGERMVGDIDVLVDCNQAKNAQSALIENGYNALKPKTYIWKKHHLPRLVNNKKLFAVEVHEKILNKIQNDDLNNCGTIDKILEKENEILLKICVQNHQINDNCLLRCKYNYRALYDFKKVWDKNIKKENFAKWSYSSFFLILDYLDIMKYEKTFNFKDILYIKRLKLKRKSKAYYFLDEFICDMIENFTKRIFQILEILLNKKYRKYFIEKLNIN